MAQSASLHGRGQREREVNHPFTQWRTYSRHLFSHHLFLVLSLLLLQRIDFGVSSDVFHLTFLWIPHSFPPVHCQYALPSGEQHQGQAHSTSSAPFASQPGQRTLRKVHVNSQSFFHLIDLCTFFFNLDTLTALLGCLRYRIDDGIREDHSDIWGILNWIVWFLLFSANHSGVPTVYCKMVPKNSYRVVHVYDVLQDLIC